MGRAPRVMTAVGFFAAGVAMSVLVVFLEHQGLERASLWASILVLFLTIAIAVSGVWVAWLSLMILRETRSSGEEQRNISTPTVPPNTGDKIGGRKRSDSASGTTFNVRAQRDAYSAQEMTVINLPHEESSDPETSP